MCKLENNSLPCATKYPIVLVHGVGFRHRKFPNYWGRIPQQLQKNGAAVFYTNQDAWGSLEHNAKIIKKDIKYILTQSNAEKVNIIAHSNGGIEVRYMIHKLRMESYIASLTTVCTCHHGSKTVDRLLRLPNWILKSSAVLVNLYFKILGDEKPDFHTTCKQLSTTFCKDFNDKIKDSQNVIYQSYAAKMKNALSDLLFLIPHIIVKHIDGDNDGLVPIDSAKWGQFKGVIEGKTYRGVSHSDVVDLRRHTSKSFDICQVYIDIVMGLKRSNM